MMNTRASNVFYPEGDLKRDFATVETSCWRDRSSQEGIQRLIEEGESSSVRREGSFIANGIGRPLSPTYVYLEIHDSGYILDRW